MGIRVHKAIGYGTDTIQTTEDGHGISDSRIDSTKFFALMDKAHEMDHKNFVEWFDREEKNLIAFQTKHHPPRDETDGKIDDFDFKFLRRGIAEPNNKEVKKTFSLGSSIVWEGEYGIGKVMLFVPPTCPDWKRYDDTIDYHEETTQNEQGNRYRFLGGSGIFPWSGRWVRFRDPKPGVLKEGVDPAKYKYLDATAYSHLVGAWSKDQPAIVKGETLKHYKEDYRPIIPLDVTCVLWFFRQAFFDLDRFYNELRPMLYVYWG